MESLFESFKRDTEIRFSEKLKKLGASGLRNVLRISLDEMTDIYNHAPEKRKAIVWHSNIKPYLLALASANFDNEENIADRESAKVYDFAWEKTKQDIQRARGTRKILHLAAA